MRAFHRPVQLLVVALSLPSLPALADPCCVALACAELGRADCLTQAGIPGYCLAAQACGAAACDPAAIRPVAELSLVKINAAGDIHLTWLADPAADSYEPWLVLAKADVPLAHFLGGPERRVAKSTPSSVAEALHPGAARPGGAPLFFYNVEAVCSSARPRGGCCDGGGSNCWDGVPQTWCVNAGGSYRGDASTCAVQGCARGACCTAVGSCLGELIRDDCASRNGYYWGDDVLCSQLTLPCDWGACCEIDGRPGSCTQPLPRTSCIASPWNGRFGGPGTQCCNACTPSGACCLGPGNCIDGFDPALCATYMGQYAGDCTRCTATPPPCP